MALPLSEYKYRLKQIRHYTKGFDTAGGYDLRKASTWSSAKKAQINRYYDFINSINSREKHFYRPRNKKNLRVALTATGAESFHKFKGAFIATKSELTVTGARKKITPKIRITKKGRLKVTVGNIHRDTLLFSDFGISKKDFVLDPETALDTILDETDYKYYTIMAGEFEEGRGQGVPQQYKPDSLKQRYMELLNKYSAENYGTGKNSSYYANWLFGVIGYNFAKLNDLKEYKIAERDHKIKRDRINKKIHNAKAHKELLELIRKAYLSPKSIRRKDREKREIKTVLKKVKTLTKKQIAVKVATKDKQILKQRDLIRALIIARTKI